MQKARVIRSKAVLATDTRTFWILSETQPSVASASYWHEPSPHRDNIIFMVKAAAKIHLNVPMHDVNNDFSLRGRSNVILIAI